MPIEAIAKQGKRRFIWATKPVGLEDPNRKNTIAVVQLRQDNLEGTI